MKKIRAICAVVSMIVAVSAPVQAATVFSNYWDITPEPNDIYDAWNNTSPNPEIVEPFRTSTNALGQWELAEIMLNAYGGGIMGGGSSPATITIYADSSGSVGSAVSGASWDVDIDTGMGEDFSFSVSTVTLDADTDYWFGVEATGNNAVGWRQTLGNDNADHVFEVDGSEIPEPAALALLLVGGLALLRRRRAQICS